MKKISSLFTIVCLLVLCLAFSSNNAQAASYDKAYAAKTLAVKSYPGSSYKTIGKIKAGSIVYVYGGVSVGKDQEKWYSYQQYGFSKIKYKNKFAYVKVDDLNFANPYNWAPGVKSLVIKNNLSLHYISKHDKTKFVKSDIKNSQGYYTMYVQYNGKGKWVYHVTINCKTGWFHG